uniref:(northern house mosquito) hypothetical protein n=1 Tax=Culex pipiens TaxID=7175 RepID=A0A8D8CTS8_CULPI
MCRALLRDPPQIRLPQEKHSQKRSTFHYFWNHFLPFHSCASLPSLNDTLAVAWVAARHLLVGFPLALFKLSCTFFQTFRNLSGQSSAKHLFPETRFPMPNPTRVPGSLGVTLPRSSVTCPSELPQAGERFHLKKNGDSLFFAQSAPISTGSLPRPGTTRDATSADTTGTGFRTVLIRLLPGS